MNWKITETRIENGQIIIYVKDDNGNNIEAFIAKEHERQTIIEQITKKYIGYIKR